MRKIQYYILCLIICPFCLSACLDRQNTDTTTYSEALVTGMAFASNDSFPGLAAAKFKIITATDTGMIYNEDSLLFGTMIDTVIPHLTFNHTPYYTIFYTGADSTADTILYTGADTIDFTHQPVQLLVMASDQETWKMYNIYVNVHTVDPDLYHWDLYNDQIFTTQGAESKAFLINDVFHLFVSNGFNTQLYTSQDAKAWSQPTTVSALPSGCAIRKMIEADGTLYYPAGDKLYTSTDGINWGTADISDFTLVNMLFSFNDSIWGIAQTSANELKLCNMAKGGSMALSGISLPADFPVSEYAALPFASASNRKRAMIVGGFDQAGNSLNSRWNLDYLKGKGYTLVNFSIEQPSFASLTGASIVVYNNELHMFGSVSADNAISGDNQLISVDEGLNWLVPDSAENLMPDTYRNRQKASVLVRESTHELFIIGGQTRGETFSDVYRGLLNKLTFLRQDPD